MLSGLLVFGSSKPLSCGLNEPRMKAKIFLLFFFTFLFFQISAQPNFGVVDSIAVSGNDRTRAKIVLREMDITSGDTIYLNFLDDRLEWNRLQLMNTGLFSNAKIGITNWNPPDNKLTLKVDLKETWYLYPIPILELADRNFNVWWNEYKHRLNRLNYGLRLYHTNFTGRRDYLKFVVQLGYTHNYELKYTIPYLNKKQTWGLAFDANFKRNHEIQYTTRENKQQFYKDDEKYLLEQFESSLIFSYRPAFRIYHHFDFFYRQSRVDDQVVSELNPEFFLENKSLQRYFLLGYRFSYDSRNIRPYPTKGELFEFQIEKKGLGIFSDVNALMVRAKGTHYWEINKKLNLENVVEAATGLIRQRQPFNNSRALGFGKSLVRGYEYYVVDGLDYVLSRNSLRFEIFNKEVKFGKWMRFKAFQSLPIKAYLALNADAGYANNPFYSGENSLDNQLLVGGGPGLDLVFYYNMVFKINYSFNGLGEKGLFLHTELGF